jgi:hypothetical protein
MFKAFAKMKEFSQVVDCKGADELANGSHQYYNYSLHKRGEDGYQEE